MALDISYDRVTKTRDAIARYSNDLVERYVKPCTYAIENCGLSGDKLKQLQETAASANEMLMSAAKFLGGLNGFEEGSIAGTYDDIAKGYAEYLEEQNFKEAQSQAQDAARQSFTSQRGAKKPVN